MPDPALAAAADPGVVCKAALSTMWLVDSAVDKHGQWDADQRTLPYLTGAAERKVRSEPPTIDQGLALLASHRAYTVVTVTPGRDDGAPADTPAKVFRQWIVTDKPVGRDGWNGTSVTNVVFVTVVRQGSGPWRISDLVLS
jgi:hypothetical protein